MSRPLYAGNGAGQHCFTTRDKIVDIGPIQVTADKKKTLPLPPIVGAVALVGGIVLLVMGNKKG